MGHRSENQGCALLAWVESLRPLKNYPHKPERRSIMVGLQIPAYAEQGSIRDKKLQIIPLRCFESHAAMDYMKACNPIKQKRP